MYVESSRSMVYHGMDIISATTAAASASQCAQEDSRALAEAYHRDGFVTPLRICSQDLAAAALAEVEGFARRQEGGVVSGDLRFKPHLHLPRCNELVRHPVVLRRVRDVLGTEDILLWSSDLNIKRPGDQGFYSAHQDATYTGLEPADRACTLWLALSGPVDAVTGGLVFEPGSHKEGQLPHVEVADPKNMLSRGQSVQREARARPEVLAELSAGEASIHHLFLVHRSSPNVGSDSRVGLAMRFIAASVRQTGCARECVTPFGALEHDGFDVEPTLPDHPDADDIAAGRAAHADAMRREKANYFADSAAAEYS